jgi:hypothetical protein
VKAETMRKHSRKSGLPPRITGTVSNTEKRLHVKNTNGRFGWYTDFLTADVREALRLPSRPEPESEWTDEDQRQMQRSDPDQGVRADQEIFNEVTFEHEVGNSLWWAVREYIIACIDKVDPKQFRQGATAGEKNASKLLAVISGSVHPSDRLTPRAINQVRKARALTHAIDQVKGEHDSEEAIAALEWLISRLADIRSAEGGRGRDANRAAHQLIADLAQIFEECTRQPPTRSNLADGSDINGPFGKFVKAVDVQLPAFRLPDIDNLIRQEVARRRTG